ncbi:4'-phosphopantetheinyl transferase family protein [Motilimonas pumila]|uniref:4'-phosphopantetheinyl transferase family protein n=1 Tax=Motilimonas pumila TaxID=2303987 RepID=UPI0011C3EFE2|nr:4'-phosphopantetheinyl transferase superfamily protein [Motilimonas pumila]
MQKHDLDLSNVAVIYTDINMLTELSFTSLSKHWSTPEEIELLSQSQNEEKNLSRIYARILIRQALFKLAPHIEPVDWIIEHNDAGQPTLSCSHYNFVDKIMPHISISYSYPYVAVALHNEPLGLDLEKHDLSLNYLTIVKNYFGPGEEADIQTLEKQHRRHYFYRLWTLKEATGKLLGTGLRIKLEDIRIDQDYQELLTDYGNGQIRVNRTTVSQQSHPDSLGRQLASTKNIQDVYGQWFSVEPGLHMALSQQTATPLTIEQAIL